MTKQGIRVWQHFEINMAGTGLVQNQNLQKLQGKFFGEDILKNLKKLSK
jgi:hypothetical protein